MKESYTVFVDQAKKQGMENKDQTKKNKDQIGQSSGYFSMLNRFATR